MYRSAGGASKDKAAIQLEHALTAALCLNEDVSMVTFNGGMLKHTKNHGPPRDSNRYSFIS